ncbi:hypothetical protein BKA70DRAFT_1337594 [Coprinopsis sp. MPI-PUGE-AT-0042]|nr:hypothetical protein BKA70DRAFT_1337594 [Coprinopsis sp. MPI-PUGE-AT-0042]
MTNPATFQDLPLELLKPVIESLDDRRNWHACSLVSRDFNRISTPLLYQDLDSSVVSQSHIVHPCFTIVQKPELAKHVRHVTETGFTHSLPYPNLTLQALKALSLCTSLRSFSWSDDAGSGYILYKFLQVIKRLPVPLEAIRIRSYLDVGQETWDLLTTFSGLRSISWFCMEGSPRVLQGWSEALGPTLTHLELGRCAGVPPSILTSVLMQLPKLESLLMKGAPAFAVANVLGLLPNLKILDIDYLPSGSSRSYSRAIGGALDDPRPPLTNLIIRAPSQDFQGPRALWSWILENVAGPMASLEVFKLHAFVRGMNYIEVPRTFVLGLARIHGPTLKHFEVRGAQLMLIDIEHLCDLFPQLELLECSTYLEQGDVESLKTAIAKGKKLQTIKLNIRARLTTRDVMEVMLRTPDSQIRTVSAGGFQYAGKWIRMDDEFSDEELQRPDCQVLTNMDGEKISFKFIVTMTDGGG